MRTRNLNAAKAQADHHAANGSVAWCVVEHDGFWLAVRKDSLAGREPVHVAEPPDRSRPFIERQRRGSASAPPRP